METVRASLELALSQPEIIGTWDWDLTTGLVRADKRFAELYGVDPNAAGDGAPITEFLLGIHEADRERVTAEIEASVESGEALRTNYRLMLPNGGVVFVSARGRFLEDEHGKRVRMHGVVFDRTEHILAETTFSQKEERYRAVFDTINVGFCIIEMKFDETGRAVDYLFVEVNKAFVNQTGIENAAGRWMREISPHHEQHWFDLYGKVALTGEPVSYENGAKSLDERWFDVRAIRLGDPADRHVAVFFNDISERRRMEMALRASETQFRTFAQAMPNHVWTSPPDGQLDWFNDRVLIYSGRTSGELSGTGWTGMVHEEDLPIAAADWAKALQSGKPYQTEFRLRRADGQYRWHIARAVAIVDDHDLITRWIGTNTDIDDQKRIEEALAYLNQTLEDRVEERYLELVKTQEALRQSQKMEAVGNLAGGIAHDFNNLLQVIGGSIALVQKSVAGDAQTVTRLQNALDAVTRGARLASQLLAYGRRQPLQPKPLHVGRLLRSMDDMLRRSLGGAVEIETIVAGGLWNTHVDASNLENALLNLAINARDAMNGRGTLTIEAGNGYLDETFVRTHPEVTPGQYVMIAVTDTGEGMTPELVQRAFEPFFTTKPEGKGTGLGLAMVYGFVKQSGGHVGIYSEPGHGTTVRLYLPRSCSEEAQEDVPAPARVVGGNEHVLVVEDDEAVRETVSAMLADLGYRISTAVSAEAALEYLSGGATIDLIFTDVVMPGKLKSTEMARLARAMQPGLPVLFTSGYTENSVVHDGRLDPDVELISKPYRQEDLALRLRKVLDARPVQVQAKDAPAPSTAKLRVLVCEDDALILMNTVDMLAELGFETEEAGSAQDAIEVLAAKPIDVLVTDLNLPDMSGIELAEHARQASPGIGVVFASGYVSFPGQERIADAKVLPKPYDQSALARIMSEFSAAR